MPRRCPVSKGARNRTKRRAARAASATVDRLLDATSYDDFVALHAADPDALGEPVVELLRELSQSEAYGAPFQLYVDLIVEARDDGRAAWARYQQRRTELEERGARMQPLDSAIAAAIEARDPDRVLELTADALPQAKAVGLGVWAAVLHAQRGKAFMQTRSGVHAENIEAALTEFAAGLECAPDLEMQADLAMHLGLSYGMRVYGDRAENAEAAIHWLRQVIERLDQEMPDELWAISLTNLASALLRREGPERPSGLVEAAAFCRRALDYRSPELNAYDWAHTQLNLGAVLQDLAALGEADPDEAAAAYQAVINERGRIQEEWPVGAAHYSIARLRRLQAQPNLEAFDEDDLKAFEPDTRLLAAALDSYRRAVALLEDATDPTWYGRALMELASVLDQLDRRPEALEPAREAIKYLRPTSAPRECVEAAGHLANLLAERGEWEAAADAVRDAVEAATLTFHSHLKTHGRDDETRRAGNLSRWAAFILAMVGDIEAAVLVLESGRTRSLRQRLGGVGIADDLEQLPPELRDVYLAALGDLASMPMTEDSAPAARRLQEVLAMIRQLPGQEAFAAGAQAADLAAAVEPGWPLLYVNPTPWGLLLLLVAADGEGVLVTPEIRRRPVALDVFGHLMAGDAYEATVQGREPAARDKPAPSYLVAISGQRDDDEQDPSRRRDVRRDIDSVLPWLGEKICRAIDALLRDAGAANVTLVPCGPVTVAPLDAAPWDEEGAERCLLERYVIRYAPSGLLAGTALARAQQRQSANTFLVGLADPLGDLPAARPEVQELAELFPDSRRKLAVGDQAHSHFLDREASKATHLHLACHAQGSLFDQNDAGVDLADRRVPPGELSGLGLRTRLVAVSACESAVPDIRNLPDEVSSIGTALLAAGSACAFASLWPVLDFTAALLMIRAYEEMRDGGRRPPEALRQAQLWLRSLTEEQAQEYLEAHPALQAEYRRRRRGPGTYHEEAAATVPYAHPDYWASFIAVGA